MKANGNGRPAPRPEAEQLPDLAAQIEAAARDALTAADRLATALVRATRKDSEATTLSTEEHEDKIQDAGTELLIAGALLQTHGWWVPENIEALVTIIKNADRSTRNDRNEAIAHLVLDHCNWLARTRRRLDRKKSQERG